jgi:serine/threonine protein kinase
MGVVYSARDLKLGRLVALKFLPVEWCHDEDAKQRFVREAQAASSTDHVNICTVHDIQSTEDGRLFIVMAVYDGETLRARIDRGPMTESEALDLATQIARALAAAHQRGIVHRDVKPDNVFITRDGVVKLLDFGLARTPDSPMSGTGTAGGTVAYMSPERAGDGHSDEQSDVWALGVMLYEMLVGARPFLADDAGATIRLIRTTDADLAALGTDLGPGTLGVVQGCLARDRAARFADGAQVLDALLRARTPGPTPERRWTWRRTAVAGTGLVVVGTAAVLMLRRSAPPQPAAPVPAAPVAHVLWVDDDPTNNRFIIEQFNRHGVQVTTALNTGDALARYDAARYDLVISDMGRYEGPNGAYVPRAGLDLLQGLRARNPAVQLGFCTSARAAGQFRAEALAAGARDIVTECEVMLQWLGIEPESPH